MSEFHSETNDPKSDLTVRVKLVNLSFNNRASERRSKATSAEQVAIVGMVGERSSRRRPSDFTKYPEPGNTEICMYSGARIAQGEFETHIEECNVCANRVELQLDFMETLEAAIYLRKAQPAARKVHGAMLISAPELNFAICGEVEPASSSDS